MIYFNCDYNEGACPKILERLVATNLEQTIGYGEDHYCMRAKELICKSIGTTDAKIHFLVGGTQTNTIVIKSLLRPHEAVLCGDSGHINVHETGAIEATGHKVMALPTKKGKITGDQVRKAVLSHQTDSAKEHTTKPKMVYISHPTEVGTLYSKKELKELKEVCDEYGLYLFLDGARLGYGLASPTTDVTLSTIYEYTDVFYIGGTKVGALFGEAVVFHRESLQEEFRYLIKQSGGMLAKGRLLGLQFMTLFEDDTYQKLGEHGVRMALYIKETLQKRGYSFYIDSDTNQQFIVLTKEQWNKIQEKFVLEKIQVLEDGNIVARICTSWATKKEDVNLLLEELQ